MGEAFLPCTSTPQTVRIQEVLDQVPVTPKYACPLDHDALQVVQQRCARVTQTQRPSSQSEALSAADEAWSCRFLGSAPQERPEVPAAFAFDHYEHVQAYAHSVPVRDQDAAETKPIRISPHIGHVAVSPKDPTLVLQISVYSRRHVPLSRRSRGLDGSSPDFSHDTPASHDIDGELVHAQTIECTSAHTLESLVSEMVCRHCDLPHARYAQPQACPRHWTGAEDAGQDNGIYPGFDAFPLQTDVCVMIDDKLYSRMDPAKDPDTSYVRALQQAAPSMMTFLRHAKFGGTLQNTRISELECLTVHRPYWLLHVGDCEHFWTVDHMRLMTEPPDLFPRTTYIQRWMLTSLFRQYWAPKKVVAQNDRHGVPCDICDGARDAVAVVLGGDAVQIRENERVRLAGMPHMVTPCCGPCFYMATGRELSHMLGADAPCGGAWTVLPLFVK